MRRIYIFGCGGSGREMLQVVHDLAQAGESIEAVAFVIDAGVNAPDQVHGLPVLRSFDLVREDPAAEIVIGVGAPHLRRKVAIRIDALGLESATLVHPRAWLGRGVAWGPGTVICAQASITCDVRMGAHVHVNVGSSVSHDCRLDDFATLAPGVRLAGNVRLEEGAECGVGACAIPGTTIGRWAMVGGGATVTNDVSPNSVAVGVPAREIRHRPDGWHDAV